MTDYFPLEDSRKIATLPMKGGALNIAGSDDGSCFLWLSTDGVTEASGFPTARLIREMSGELPVTPGPGEVNTPLGFETTDRVVAGFTQALGKATGVRSAGEHYILALSPLGFCFYMSVTRQEVLLIVQDAREAPVRSVEFTLTRDNLAAWRSKLLGTRRGHRS